MISFQENIDRQIEYNRGKNLFFDGKNKCLSFIPETILAIQRFGELGPDSEKLLADYAKDSAIVEFCRINQYFTFDKQAKDELRNLYIELFSNIKSHKMSHGSISKRHSENLKKWLQETNSFAEEIYSSKDEKIEPVACSEYNSDLQIDILQIDTSKIISPVLDIGCGRQGNLVKHLRKNGIEAYGIDRFAPDHPFLTNSDWLEHEYGIEKWGTITSNLGFSNHFKHHHIRKDGNFIMYAKKYMDILNSLKIGGSFHYTPDLPFIEQYLDVSKFQMVRQNIGKLDFKTTTIRHLK
jgi:hypothetical protein